MAVSCQRAVDFVGMPEAYMPLAETTIYLALARKSNSSYAAYLNARREVRSQGPLSVPLHLRTAVTPLRRNGATAAATNTRTPTAAGTWSRTTCLTGS